MHDEALRRLVRTAIARHLGRSPDAATVGSPGGSHPSHARLALTRPSGDDACLIEPMVRCVHCGYCESFGH